LSRLLRTRSIDALIASSEDPEKCLRKTLGPWSLTAFGVGAVIGSGIFILTGTAAADPRFAAQRRQCGFDHRAAGRGTGDFALVPGHGFRL
jgi:hypothetical protein